MSQIQVRPTNDASAPHAHTYELWISFPYCYLKALSNSLYLELLHQDAFYIAWLILRKLPFVFQLCTPVLLLLTKTIKNCYLFFFYKAEIKYKYI